MLVNPGWRWARLWAAFLLVVAGSPEICAQTVEPPADSLPSTPAGYPPPPAGYMYVPLVQAGTPVLPRAVAPARPAEIPYREGQILPEGYHLEETPRRGLVIAGYIVSAIPYGISVLAATSANFENASGYLLVPFLGPWLTLGRRNYHSCSSNNSISAGGSTSGDVNGSASSSNDFGCAADALVVTGLVMDGLMQVTGGSLLLAGYIAKKTRVVRDDTRLSLRPTVTGTWVGLNVSGAF